ncbi:hypothetical protein TWF696_004728 [Orbilia brochopaga]|uniref:Uncharacterized protein n=1 Tax=Orbilia brochopaga TaxID=3140254 RepID=A0AAV9UZH4_9PEZI
MPRSSSILAEDFSQWRFFPGRSPQPVYPMRPAPSNCNPNLRPVPPPEPLPALTITCTTAGMLIRAIEDYEFTMLHHRREIAPDIPPSLDSISTINYHLSGLLKSINSILPPEHHSESSPFNDLLAQLARSLEALQGITPPRQSGDHVSFTSSLQYKCILQSTNMKLKKFKDMLHGYTFPPPSPSLESEDISSILLPATIRDCPLTAERHRSIVESTPSNSSDSIRSTTSIYASLWSRFLPFSTVNTTPESNPTPPTTIEATPVEPVRVPSPPPSLPIPIPTVASNPALKAATDYYRRTLREQPKPAPRRRPQPAQPARPALYRQRTRDPKERAAHIRRMKEANERATEQPTQKGTPETTQEPDTQADIQADIQADTQVEPQTSHLVALEPANEQNIQQRDQQRQNSRARLPSPSRLAQVENVALAAANTAMDVLTFSHWKRQKQPSAAA